jgi:hypothetical protein
MSLADTLSDNGAPPPPPPPPLHDDVENSDNTAEVPSPKTIDDDPQVREVLASEVGLAYCNVSFNMRANSDSLYRWELRLCLAG